MSGRERSAGRARHVGDLRTPPGEQPRPRSTGATKGPELDGSLRVDFLGFHEPLYAERQAFILNTCSAMVTGSGE